MKLNLKSMAELIGSVYPYSLLFMILKMDNREPVEIFKYNLAEFYKQYSAFSDIEKVVLEYRYSGKKTLQQIATSYAHVNKERVRQIEAKAIRRLRQLLPTFRNVSIYEYEKKMKELRMELSDDFPISDLNLSTRTYNALRKEFGPEVTVQGIINFDKKDFNFLQVRNFGMKSYEELVVKIKESANYEMKSYSDLKEKFK